MSIKLFDASEISNLLKLALQSTKQGFYHIFVLLYFYIS